MNTFLAATYLTSKKNDLQFVKKNTIVINNDENTEEVGDKTCCLK